MAVRTELLPVSTQEHLPPQVQLVPAEYTADTLLNWTAWINKPDVRHWMTANLPETRDEVKQWLYNATHDSNRHYFTIMADGKAVGLISLRQDEEPETTGEIGIAIGDPNYRSKKVGTQALSQLLDYASGIGLAGIRAHIRPDNEKSLRLFIGHGFVHTGDISLDGERFRRYEKDLTPVASADLFAVTITHTAEPSYAPSAVTVTTAI